MAISVGQHAVASVGGQNPQTSSITTASSGSSFIAITVYDTAGSFTSYTDSKSNTYGNIFAAAGPAFFGGVVRVRVDLATNGTGGAGHTLRANTSGVSAASVYLIEIVGGVTSSLVDVAATGIEDTISPFTTNLTGTLAQADELAICVYLSDAPSGTEVFTLGNSFSAVDQVTDANSFWTSIAASRVVSATTSIQASLTKTQGSKAYGVIFTLKAAASAPSLALPMTVGLINPLLRM